MAAFTIPVYKVERPKACHAPARARLAPSCARFVQAIPTRADVEVVRGLFRDELPNVHMGHMAWELVKDDRGARNFLMDRLQAVALSDVEAGAKRFVGTYEAAMRVFLARMFADLSASEMDRVLHELFGFSDELHMQPGNPAFWVGKKELPIPLPHFPQTRTVLNKLLEIISVPKLYAPPGLGGKAFVMDPVELDVKLLQASSFSMVPALLAVLTIPLVGVGAERRSHGPKVPLQTPSSRRQIVHPLH